MRLDIELEEVEQQSNASREERSACIYERILIFMSCLSELVARYIKRPVANTKYVYSW